MDPYRDDPGEDLTGQSIARSTLVRLANYESLHPSRLRPEVMAYKGRALELLGDYESARRNYLEAAEYDTEMSEDLRRRAGILEQMLVVQKSRPTGSDLNAMLGVLAGQASDFRRLAREFDGEFYQSLAMVEAEEAEVRRAELMARNRDLLADGEDQALRALESLVRNHQESRRRLEHALRLAHFHRQLAEQEVRLRPPSRAGFSRETFQEHFDAAVDLLYRISQADGRPERQVARHELDGLLAWGEQIRSQAR